MFKLKNLDGRFLTRSHLRRAHPILSSLTSFYHSRLFFSLQHGQQYPFISNLDNRWLVGYRKSVRIDLNEPINRSIQLSSIFFSLSLILALSYSFSSSFSLISSPHFSLQFSPHFSLQLSSFHSLCRSLLISLFLQLSPHFSLSLSSFFSLFFFLSLKLSKTFYSLIQTVPVIVPPTNKQVRF